ncbi:hypothetical protein YB2330_003659 [Saitoella coloradoensis]
MSAKDQGSYVSEHNPTLSTSGLPQPDPPAKGYEASPSDLKRELATGSGAQTIDEQVAGTDNPVPRDSAARVGSDLTATADETKPVSKGV